MILFLILTLSSPAFGESFRLSLMGEPHSLDPQTTTSRGGNYLFHSIYRGLYRYHGRRGLILEGAKSCQRSPLKLICQLNPQHRWSTGGVIDASAYVRTFRQLINPEKKSPQSDLILTLKNARSIIAGEKLPSHLGVQAVNSRTLRFDFSEEDPEFEFKLINPALTPTPEGGFLTTLPLPDQTLEVPSSGPYKIQRWKRGHSIFLVPSLEYQLPANAQRPELEMFFIDDDATALRLYEAGKLNFLRRLTSEETPRFRQSKEFFQIPMARFDYVGFGPELQALPKLREALTQAVDFQGFLSLFFTKSPPGCPSLPARLMDRSQCLQPQIAQAQKLMGSSDNLPKLKFYFSKMGGDDIARAAEWFQGQWKKNLNLPVELNSEEQIVYLRRLKVKPPMIFRKGISLDRPTCLAAVELFTKNSPENYIGLNDEKFERLVTELKQAQNPSERRVNCRKAVEHLLSTHLMIPLGEMYFTLLAKTQFSNWDLNELNQLDLTDLTYRPAQ